MEEILAELQNPRQVKSIGVIQQGKGDSGILPKSNQWSPNRHFVFNGCFASGVGSWLSAGGDSGRDYDEFILPDAPGVIVW